MGGDRETTPGPGPGDKHHHDDAPPPPPSPEEISHNPVSARFESAIQDMHEALVTVQGILEEGGHDKIGPDMTLSADQRAILDAVKAGGGEFTGAWQTFREAWEEFGKAAEEAPEDFEIRKTWAETAQGVLEDFLDQSGFVDWARHQRGVHRGDVEIVGMILDKRPRVPKAYEEEGPTFLGWMMDAVMIHSPVAEAHRNRIGMIQDAISSELATRPEAELGTPFRVMVFGVGKGYEFKDIFERNTGVSGIEDLEIALRDFDPKALIESLKTIHKSAENVGKTVQVETDQIDRLMENALERDVLNAEDAHFLSQLRKFPDSEPLANAISVEVDAAFTDATDWILPKIRRREGASGLEEKCDVIICAGLYDYLDSRKEERTAKAMTEALFECAKDGGLMLLTNVTPANDWRYQQEFLVNWPLVYRDSKEMEVFGTHVGNTKNESIEITDPFHTDTRRLQRGEFCVTEDETRVNTFLWTRNKAA